MCQPEPNVSVYCDAPLYRGARVQCIVNGPESVRSKSEHRVHRGLKGRHLGRIVNLSGTVHFEDRSL